MWTRTESAQAAKERADHELFRRELYPDVDLNDDQDEPATDTAPNRPCLGPVELPDPNQMLEEPNTTKINCISDQAQDPRPPAEAAPDQEAASTRKEIEITLYSGWDEDREEPIEIWINDPSDFRDPYADAEARYHLDHWNESDPTLILSMLGSDATKADTAKGGYNNPNLGDPDARARLRLSTWAEGDPTIPTHDVTILGPDADLFDQLLVTPTSPVLSLEPEPSPKSRRTPSRRLLTD